MPSNPFPAAPDPERFHALLRRLQGVGGYSTDPDGLRDGELRAYAELLAEVAHAIERAGEQAFPSLGVELLEEWERAYGLPNDAARTISERQQRILAAEREVGGASKARIETVIRTVAADVADPALANTRTGVIDDAVEAPIIFQPAIQISEAEFEAPRTRRAVERMVRKSLPVRAWGQHGVPDPAQAVVVKTDAEWGSVDHRLDRDAIRKQEGTSYGTRPGVSRYRSFGPLTRLRSADLNEIQERMLLDFAKGDGVDLFTGSPGGDFVAISIAAGLGTTSVDDSIDWRDRMILCGLCLHASTDIRPGESGDSSFSTGTQASGLWYTGTGGTGGYRWEPLTSLFLQVNATTGVLEINNSTGGTVYVVGMLLATQDTGMR